MSDVCEKKGPHERSASCKRSAPAFQGFLRSVSRHREENGRLTSFLIHVSVTPGSRYVDRVEETFFSRGKSCSRELERECILCRGRERRQRAEVAGAEDKDEYTDEDTGLMSEVDAKGERGWNGGVVISLSMIKRTESVSEL